MSCPFDMKCIAFRMELGCGNWNSDFIVSKRSSCVQTVRVN